ncbi:uncharacterized protein LOC133293744 [Gastrolobium bilobum]|uniref:uncharacterized protein LOC133293744 n=1 Tax=Gastrolobium bilobum TaxID=150636 RepID=UPI002AB07692|nr:uncharacterized protein LOC133293744 [Gastrolobium bilobum]
MYKHCNYENDTTANLVELFPILRVWNNHTFGIINKRKSFIIRRLDGILRNLEIRLNSFLANLDIELRHELEEILELKEQLWYQKSRTTWIQGGDRNIKFYHTYAIARGRRNKILALKNDARIWIRSESVLKRLVTKFYQKLFSEDHPFRNRPHLELVEKQTLSKLFTAEEIMSTIFQMGPNKSLDLDGFLVAFC